jgi:hypothetical protein
LGRPGRRWDGALSLATGTGLAGWAGEALDVVVVVDTRPER